MLGMRRKRNYDLNELEVSETDYEHSRVFREALQVKMIGFLNVTATFPQEIAI